MSDKSFFDGWVGRAVEFTNTVEPSRGTLEAICGDHKNQLSTKAYFESEGTRGKPSAAYGALRCRNIYNPDEVAFMRIIMQIPAGFEYAMSPERSRQATDALPSMTCNELKCLKIITKNNCKSAPIIRHHPVVEQDDNGLVLGGFLHYILMDHASGYNWNGAEAWSRGTTSSGPLASKSELASATLSTRHVRMFCLALLYSPLSLDTCKKLTTRRG
ncbi:hypothetical protein BJX76DRAFT_358814 [Aspergillus varians]